jgi:proteasome accessory factor C
VSARINASARVQRLLAMLQWAAARPEGVEVDELCERFRLSSSALVKELDLASMVGADSPEYHDMPFEVFVEDGRVYVRLFSFRRALRLTPAEGLALVAAADVLVDDDDSDSPLARALHKLADLLGIEPGQAVDVDLDPEGGDDGRTLRQAIADRCRVAFTYWTYGRDAVARRTVDPWQLFESGGSWYLTAHDPAAGGERRFRLDRMEDLELLEEPASAPPKGLTAALAVGEAAPRVVLDLAPAAGWVAEAHPVEAAEARPDGWSRVTLAVSGSPWLERLLLQLGPDAEVVEIDDELGDARIASAAATRVLARYRDRASPGTR